MGQRSAISSVRFGPTPQVTDVGGPDQLLSSAKEGVRRRHRDVYVTLQYPDLRHLLIGRLADRKGVTLSKLVPGSADDRPVSVYEVLTQERYRLFSRIRSEAQRLGVHVCLALIRSFLREVFQR